MISHATCQETEIETHSLDMFSSPIISHATHEEKQRQAHSLDMFHVT